MKYNGPGVENVQRLIYPCPSKSLDSLGTHLVSDLHMGESSPSILFT